MTVTDDQQQERAAQLSRELLSDEALDELLASVGAGGVRLTGRAGSCRR